MIVAYDVKTEKEPQTGDVVLLKVVAIKKWSLTQV